MWRRRCEESGRLCERVQPRPAMACSTTVASVNEGCEMLVRLECYVQWAEGFGACLVARVRRSICLWLCDARDADRSDSDSASGEVCGGPCTVCVREFIVCVQCGAVDCVSGPPFFSSFQRARITYLASTFLVTVRFSVHGCSPTPFSRTQCVFQLPWSCVK